MLKYADMPTPMTLFIFSSRRAQRLTPARANTAARLLFHSDRGIEYGAYRYRTALTRHNIQPSMNRPGHCHDNAYMASFFHSMKAEWIRGGSFDSYEALDSALKSYMRFYNHHRLHSGIDYHTPEEYERLTA